LTLFSTLSRQPLPARAILRKSAAICFSCHGFSAALSGASLNAIVGIGSPKRFTFALSSVSLLSRSGITS